MKDRELVIVIHGTAEAIASGSISVISSHAGTRIYERDKVDSRLTVSEDAPPYFSDLGSAMNYIKDHPNEPVQLALSEARRCDLL